MINSGSWKIITDIPEALHFSAYVGQQEKFEINKSEGFANQAEKEWQQWWEALPFSNVDISKSLPDFREAKKAGQSELDILRQFDYQTFLWHPPHFDNLSHLSTLQNLFHNYWPSFLGVRNSETMKMVAKSETYLSRHLWELVKDCTKSKGKQKANPFVFQLDFVPWPSDYMREVSERYIILGASYLEENKWKI